eukprot:g13119.t1
MDAIGLNAFEDNNIALAAKQAAYGKERLWGAVSWAITHILIGFLMDTFHVASTVLYTFSIVSLLLFVAIVFWTQTLRNGRTKLSTSEEDGVELHTAAVADEVLFESQVSDVGTAAVSLNTNEDFESENRCDEQVLIGNTTTQARSWIPIKDILCKDAHSIVFFLDVTVLGMGTSLVEGLVFVFFVHDLNASNSLCGISVLITVLFEIPIFYYSDYVVECFSNRTLMGIAHLAYVVRVVGYTVIPNPWWLLMLEHSLGAEKVLELVEEAYQDGSKAPIDIVFDNMVGEPTLEMNTLVEAGRLIKERRHGVPLTVNTNGLLGSAGAEQLFDMDVRQS